MAVFGILTGLCASLIYVFAFLAGRSWTVKRNGGGVALLLISHVMMSLVSLPVMFLLWPKEATVVSSAQLFENTWLIYVILCGGFYLVAQGALNLALHLEDASRVGPLLGLKLLFVPIFSLWLLGQSQAPGQWVAVLLAFCSALVLSYTGGRLSIKALGLVLLATIGYTLFDVYAKKLTFVFSDTAPYLITIWCLSVVLVLSGLVGVLVIVARKGMDYKISDWHAAVPHSIGCVTALYLLFITFGLVGIVYGNILLATRGIMGVVVGALVAYLGYAHLEQKVSFSIVVRRGVAAVGLGLAIVLYAVCKPVVDTDKEITETDTVAFNNEV